MERFLPSNFEEIATGQLAGDIPNRVVEPKAEYAEQLRAFAAECERLYGERYDAVEIKRQTAVTMRAEADRLDAEAADEEAALMKERRAAGHHKFPTEEK